MISYHLGAKDLARVRFAFSPLQECVQSYRAMSMGPLARSLHTPWFARARRRLAGVDLEPMAVLVRSRHYIPDFLTPPPLAARAPLADEIERMVATPGDLVRQEVHETFGDEVPPAAMPYLTDTEGAVDRLATLLTVYWERAVAPDWPRIAALLERDVAAQAQVLALEGPEALFHRRLHPKMSWRGDTVMLEKETTCPDRTMDLDGQGLVLIPSVFSWPHVSTVINPAPRPSGTRPPASPSCGGQRRRRPLPRSNACSAPAEPRSCSN